jgi:hypothetical protein
MNNPLADILHKMNSSLKENSKFMTFESNYKTPLAVKKSRNSLWGVKTQSHINFMVNMLYHI